MFNKKKKQEDKNGKKQLYIKVQTKIIVHEMTWT